MKNKIMLLALLASSNFLVGMDAGAGAGSAAGAGAGAGDKTTGASGSLLAKLEAKFNGIRTILEDKSCNLSREDVFRLCDSEFRAATAQLELNCVLTERDIRGQLQESRFTVGILQSRLGSSQQENTGIKDACSRQEAEVSRLEKLNKELQGRGLALEKGASKKFVIGLVTGAVVVAAAGAGAIVYVVNKKPELLGRLKR